MREDLSEEELNEEVLEDYTLDDTSSMPSSSGIQIPKVSIKDIARTTVDNTGKAVDTAGKGVQAAGKTAEVAGKGTEAAGKGAQAAGKSLQAAGKGAQAAGDAVASASSALGAIPYVGGVLAGAGKVAGGATKAVGKGAEVAGTGIDKAGAGMEKAGQGMQQTGKNINKTGKGISDTGKRIREAAGNKKGISSSEIGAKLEDKFSTENITEEAKKGVKKKIKNIKQDVKDAMNPTDMNLGAQIRRIKRLAKLYFTLLLGYIVVVAILIYILFSPILDAIQWMDDHWDSISTRAEKTNNFYAGFGNQSTKEAFFEELNYLYGEYDEQLDVPLIMATLFYKEREGYNTSYSGVPKDDTGDLAELDTATLIKQATSFLKTKYKDLYETLDEDGKNYTIGKIYRLRKLARHQLDSSLFGGLPSETEEIPLKDFLERVEDRMSADLYQLYQSIQGASLTDLLEIFKKIYELISIADGSETWTTTSFANWSEPATALGNLLKESILTGLEIQTVRYDIDDAEFKVTILKYDYNEDNYKKYLKDYYVRKMPEFSENLVGLSDEEKEREIDKIIKEIYEYSDQFKEIYGYVEVGSSEEYSEECIGNLDETLVSKLLLPIKEGGTYSFTDEYAYGISNGVTNNGLDLNSSTAGVKEGDDVYAIAAGEVIEVVSNLKCNTKDDSKCNPLGNYIKIEHTIKEDDQTFKIVSIYTNLKAGSVKLKKKDKVKKGDVIGKIGKTGDVTEAQLHFEIHDISNGDIPLNPTNLFIPCVSSGSLVGADNEEKIWFYLTKIAKYPKKAAAGAMGNLSKESAGFHPEIVQGDVPISKYSYDYTNKVDKKTISEYNFVNNGPGGGGYGLAQWTYYTRKQELYDLMEKRKTSIGDLEMQLEHLKNEIASNEWTSAQRKNWENASTPSEAARIFCVYFERPGAGCSTERETIAEQIYKKYKDKKYSSNISADNLGGNVSDERQKLVNYAKSFVGHPYVYGGTILCTNWKNKSGCGVDCSAFVQQVFKKFGYDISRTTNTQINDGESIKESELKPGDIILYNENSNGVGHVAIYIGNNQIVHAGSSSTGVQIKDNYKYRTVKAYRRIIKD